MIIIYYYYWKKDTPKSHWEKAEKTFDSVLKASRFCWGMKKRKMILDGWSCNNPEDNQELNIKVNIAKINGWRV